MSSRSVLCRTTPVLTMPGVPADVPLPPDGPSVRSWTHAFPSTASAGVGFARAHVKVADARREFHHQFSTHIIRENQAVFVADLAVKGPA